LHAFLALEHEIVIWLTCILSYSNLVNYLFDAIGSFVIIWAYTKLWNSDNSLVDEKIAILIQA
jgi:hypothetical protein